jgi:hypothetical protein
MDTCLPIKWNSSEIVYLMVRLYLPEKIQEVFEFIFFDNYYEFILCVIEFFFMLVPLGMSMMTGPTFEYRKSMDGLYYYSNFELEDSKRLKPRVLGVGFPELLSLLAITTGNYLVMLKIKDNNCGSDITPSNIIYSSTICRNMAFFNLYSVISNDDVLNPTYLATKLDYQSFFEILFLSIFVLIICKTIQNNNSPDFNPDNDIMIVLHIIIKFVRIDVLLTLLMFAKKTCSLNVSVTVIFDGRGPGLFHWTVLMFSNFLFGYLEWICCVKIHDEMERSVEDEEFTNDDSFLLD